MTKTKKTIIITGASSGLGAALAKAYASFEIRLFLFGRSMERLNRIAEDCRSLKSEVTTIECDVTNQVEMHEHISKISQLYGIDIIIACAGISAGTLGKPESIEQVNAIFATNLQGTLNTIMPAIDFMLTRQKGKVVIISSMAGLLGLSSAPAYSASKCAVKNLGDALRGYLKQFNIDVCVVIPGYVDTPMTKVNKFPMPFKISAEKAATIIMQGIERRNGIIAFPKVIYILLKLVNLLPYRLLDYINSKLPGK